MKRAYLFLNGELLGEKEFYKTYIESYPGDIYCADGGYNYLKILSLTPLEVWGDMDSIEENFLEELEKTSNKDFTPRIKLKKFSKEKDFTDGELIISYLNSKEYEEIVIIGGLGGKKSHELTNLNLFGKYSNLVFLTEEEKIFYLKKETILEGLKDRIISLVPLASSVENLTLKGFYYPLENYSLNLGDSRCISNIISEDIAKVSYTSGFLLGIIEKK